MFAKLTENRDRPKGKCANEMTIKNITTQYDLGRPEWYGGWESNTKASFKVDNIQSYKFLEIQQSDQPYERVSACKRTGNQICFGTDKVDYLSNTKSNFIHNPDEFQPARPLKDKAMLSATNYSLGDDKVVYKSSAMNQFQHPQRQQMKEQPTYKNYNQRVDIITGQVYDQNKRSYGFEGYSEDPQHKRSQNQTVLPQDLYVVDPITGRKIIRV